MRAFHDDADKQRFEEAFFDTDGTQRLVFADYADRDGARAILHVEADPALRGTGAAGEFMQDLADHARREGLRLLPICGYAVAWFRRHPDQQDLLA